MQVFLMFGLPSYHTQFSNFLWLKGSSSQRRTYENGCNLVLCFLSMKICEPLRTYKPFITCVLRGAWRLLFPLQYENRKVRYRERFVFSYDSNFVISSIDKTRTRNKIVKNVELVVRYKLINKHNEFLILVVVLMFPHFSTVDFQN